MPFAPAPPLRLRQGDREKLEAMVRKRTLAQRLVFRAQILLSCADGLPHRQIKRQLHTSVDTILRWRDRYKQDGLDGLQDRPRSGRPRTFSP
jgi:transposase